jgi:transcriptional regulator with XRE-family HTH domain
MNDHALRAFAGRLAAAREAGGWSQEDVARNCGLNLGTYRNWEQARNEPKLLAVVPVARFLRVSLDELVGLIVRPDEQRPRGSNAGGGPMTTRREEE